MAAASVLVVSGDRVLGITRGTDLRDIGFPGGKADPTDASLTHTAVRELREETGVRVHPDDLVPLVRHGRHVLFYAPTVRSWPHRLASRPFEGFVGLWPAQAFLGDGCRHAQHQAEALSMIGLVT